MRVVNNFKHDWAKRGRLGNFGQFWATFPFSLKIQKLFGELRANIPPSEWNLIYIVGDFNINFALKDKELKNLKALARHMRLQPADPGDATHRNGKKIDYMVHGNLLEVKELVF